MRKRDAERAEAHRLHDEIIERLVAQAVERIAQVRLRRQMDRAWVLREKEKRK